MTHQQFIVLLCVYALAVALGFVTERFVPLPEHVTNAKPNRKEILGRESKLYVRVLMVTSTLILGCGLVGFIGMFFLWRAAPWLFAGSVAGKIASFPTLCWSVESELHSRLSGLELLLDGVILTLVFFGPARHLFFQ